MRSALVTGLRDYVEKNGFDHVVLGISGGIDSALTAAVAVDALGADCPLPPVDRLPNLVTHCAGQRAPVHQSYSRTGVVQGDI